VATDERVEDAGWERRVQSHVRSLREWRWRTVEGRCDSQFASRGTDRLLLLRWGWRNIVSMHISYAARTGRRRKLWELQLVGLLLQKTDDAAHGISPPLNVPGSNVLRLGQASAQSDLRRVPPRLWIEERLSRLQELLGRNTGRSALLLCKLLGPVKLEPTTGDIGWPYYRARTSVEYAGLA
jgi:hypothetical protein